MIYLEKPENFNSKFDVVSCFLEHNGKILLLHRQDFKPQGNTWGVPAGKVESNEKPLEAMIRELREETGYEATPKQIIFSKTVFVRYPDLEFVYHIYSLSLDKYHETKIDDMAHKAFEWVTPKEALNRNLIPDLDEYIRLHYDI